MSYRKLFLYNYTDEYLIELIFFHYFHDLTFIKAHEYGYVLRSNNNIGNIYTQSVEILLLISALLVNSHCFNFQVSFWLLQLL